MIWALLLHLVDLEQRAAILKGGVILSVILGVAVTWRVSSQTCAPVVKLSVSFA